MSSASPKKQHDVFISFRGEDIRKTFMPQLHQALINDNFETYIDYNLKKGEDVGPALSKAIEESHMSIVVFTENYATSKWCLDELVQILESRKEHGLVVIPVFYETDPSDVRKQKGSYETPFGRYEGEGMSNTVSSWRAALTQAASISGFDSRNYRDDSELIKEIVKDVWKNLSKLYPNELKYLVQIDEKNEDIESLLKKYQRIGIWGMGGIGKTTIAKQVFAKNFAQYDSACLLENVREESQMFGAMHVRNKLLSELLKQPITASDVVGLHKFNKVRLNGKKVFIVLDDVDDTEQLEDLCRGLGDLGPQSRLIITTRDKHLLSGRVDGIYGVTHWKLEESKELFCLHAFTQSHLKVCYEKLIDRAVAYAGGVPLALKVLGSYFHSKDLKFWESKLNYLEDKKESLDKIQKVLRVSYDGLSRSEKDIFLDIAFFFKDENEDFVTKILDACDFNATCGIRILKDKALITISYGKRIQMHDLLQEMAFNIVRFQNGCTSGDLIKRSRLRDVVEVCDILKGSHNKVEGITFDFSQKADLNVLADTFNMMTKLRYLRLYVPLGMKRLATVSLPEDIMPFSGKLRYLEWNGYPLKSLPQPFFAKLLVEIRLPHSNVEHLWHGVQELEKLEGIDLSECKQLIKLPDLSAAPKLKWLYLSGCESLWEVQPSVFSKDTLVTLLLDRCTKLQSLMSETRLSSLQTLNVDGCISLKEFSLSSSLIDKLDLRNTGIEILHPSIGGMSKLESLNLEGLMLQDLPREMSRLCSLTQLRLSNCSIVTKSKLEAIFGDDGLKSLKVLYLKNCCNLFELPSNISSLASLYKLRLDGSNVKMLPRSIKDLLELEILSLDNCRELCCLAELPPQIKEFHADNCTSLVTVSTLKSFSTSMTGGKKYISFKNSSKMESNGPSLNRVTEDVILMMMIAAYHNVEVKKSGERHGYNYNHAEVCLPGSTLPRQFEYGPTGSSSIEMGINFSDLIGFIFCIVVSPLHEMKRHDNNNNGAQIQCEVRPQSGNVMGCTSVLHSKAISNLNMDHVLLWYNPYHFDEIRFCFCYSPILLLYSFQFRIIANTQGERLDKLFNIKECGIYPIYRYEIPMPLDSMNLDKKSNILPESSRKSQEDIETSSNKQEQLEQEDYTGPGGSEDAKLMLKSKGNEEIPIESDAEMQQPVVSVVEETASKGKSSVNNYSWQGNFEETKQYSVEDNPNLQGEKFTVSDTNSLIIKQPNQEKENTPIVDLGKPEGEEEGSDGDPFAELESILLRSPESSPKATCSTSDVAIRDALHNLECLLENSLESIHGDIELQGQLQMSLECIKQTSHDKISPKVARLVDNMTSSIDNIFIDFALAKKVVQDHISHLQHKEKLMQRMSDAKKRKELVKKEKSQCEDEARCLEEEAKMLDEKIRILVEQKKNVELKKGEMEERVKRCEGEEKELVDEAKNMIPEAKELVSVITNSTSSYEAALQKQQKLNDKWEGFKTAFIDTWGS